MKSNGDQIIVYYYIVILLRMDPKSIVHDACGPPLSLGFWPRPCYTPSCPKSIRTYRFAIRCSPIERDKNDDPYNYNL